MPRLGFALFALMGVAAQAHAACAPQSVLMPLSGSAAQEGESPGVSLGVHPGLGAWMRCRRSGMTCTPGAGRR